MMNNGVKLVPIPGASITGVTPIIKPRPSIPAKPAVPSADKKPQFLVTTTNTTTTGRNSPVPAAQQTDNGVKRNPIHLAALASARRRSLSKEQV